MSAMGSLLTRDEPPNSPFTMLFPQPDSPTIASVSPRSTPYETPSTAFTVPESVENSTCRSVELQ